MLVLIIIINNHLNFPINILQQEQIDSVEYYALQATEHVESGGHELLKGTVSRRKAKKVLILILYFTTFYLRFHSTSQVSGFVGDMKHSEWCVVPERLV